MAVLRLFASAREAAGTPSVDIDGATVGEVLDVASSRFGEPFVAVLGRARVWLNGEPAERDHAVEPADVVAVLPPVSGGATSVSRTALTAPALGLRARLGVAWVVVSASMAWLGRGWLAGWFAAAAFLAAAQVARAWRRRGDHPVSVMAAAGAAAIVAGASFGLVVSATTAAATVAITILVRAARTGGLALGRPVRDVVLTAGIALAIGTAAGSPVLLRGR
ncbi:MAG: MoaD/ThiS family protein, partial [Acidimicrobiales bacterium]